MPEAPAAVSSVYVASPEGDTGKSTIALGVLQVLNLIPPGWAIGSGKYGVLLGTVSTVLPTFLTSAALKRIGANQVALTGCIGPVATMAFAWLFLGEKMSTVQMAGAALVLAGVLLISLKPRPATG